MYKQNSSYGGVLQTSFPFLKRQTVLNIPLLFNGYYICIDFKKWVNKIISVEDDKAKELLVIK